MRHHGVAHFRANDWPQDSSQARLRLALRKRAVRVFDVARLGQSGLALVAMLVAILRALLACKACSQAALEVWVGSPRGLCLW